MQNNAEQIPSTELLQALPKDLFRFVRMFVLLEAEIREKLRLGHHILELGGGDGGDLVPFLIALGLSNNSKALLTDVLEYAENGLSSLNAWKYYFENNPQDVLTVSHPYSTDRNPIEPFRINKEVFDKLYERLKQSFGTDWDATNPEVFNKAEESLDGPVGLVVLRHPEIGTGDEHLTEIFRNIIRNILNKLIQDEVPALITTSNNPESWKRIQETLRTYLIEQGFECEIRMGGDWGYEHEIGYTFTRGEETIIANWDTEPYDFSRSLGPRNLDAIVLRVFWD